MNKKAFIKTLEAIIAILFILGFIYVVTPKEMKIGEEIPKNVKAAQEFILQEILQNDSLRDCVINSISGGCKETDLDPLFCGDINLLTEKNTPYGYTYTCEICGIEEVSCLGEELPKDKSVYVDSIFMGSDDVAKSKIVRLYFWRGEEVPVAPPESTCQNQGYSCCEDCEPDTEHSEYNDDCFGEQVCCGTCLAACTDNDNDGYAVEGGDCGAVDCDDNNENVNPGVVEICNGLNDDCDTEIDEEPEASQSCDDNVGCTNDVCISGSCQNNPDDNLCPADKVCADYYCDINLDCQVNYESSSKLCRAAAGVCDAAEYCSGSSADCPANVYKPYGSGCGTCRHCDGNGNCQPKTTGWGANQYGCTGSTRRCYSGSCVTCGGYFYSDGCDGCAGQGGNACWYAGTWGQSCTTVCGSRGCVSAGWRDNYPTCNVCTTLQNPQGGSCWPTVNSACFPGKYLINDRCYQYRGSPVATTCGCASDNWKRVCVCNY